MSDKKKKKKPTKPRKPRKKSVKKPKVLGSITHCPECCSMVPDEAVECPHCGYNVLPHRKGKE